MTKRDRTHDDKCWREHHECAVAKVKRQQERIEDLEDTIESALCWLENAPIDYSNGIVAPNGMDEGRVRGWEGHCELENELREAIGKPVVDHKVHLENIEAGEDDLPF